jgi:hypothetical protein
MRQIKEKNLKIDLFDKKVSQIVLEISKDQEEICSFVDSFKMEKNLSEKLREFKEKEEAEFDKIKSEYELKVKTFKEKYKQLEEKEFNYLENEFKKIKEKMSDEYNAKIKTIENKLKSKHEQLKREVYKKHLEKNFPLIKNLNEHSTFDINKRK